MWAAHSPCSRQRPAAHVAHEPGFIAADDDEVLGCRVTPGPAESAEEPQTAQVLGGPSGRRLSPSRDTRHMTCDVRSYICDI